MRAFQLLPSSHRSHRNQKTHQINLRNKQQQKILRFLFIHTNFVLDDFILLFIKILSLVGSIEDRCQAICDGGLYGWTSILEKLLILSAPLTSSVNKGILTM